MRSANWRLRFHASETAAMQNTETSQYPSQWPMSSSINNASAPTMMNT